MTSKSRHGSTNAGAEFRGGRGGNVTKYKPEKIGDMTHATLAVTKADQWAQTIEHKCRRT